MKRSILVLVLALTATMLIASAALAVTKRCDGGGCLGTARGDVLYGTPGVDRISGGAGNDVVYGGGEGDELNGGAGVDTIRGNPGDDTVYGGPGDDKISGKTGSDDLYGGYGDDNIHGSLDGEPDRFFCGPGTDQAVVDPSDTVASDCEDVTRNTAR